MTAKKHRVIVYTDGGCVPNPGVGGWAAVLINGENRKEISGSEAASTNNRMELTAACEALEALKTPCEVTLHTDSEYMKRGYTEWLPKWKRNGWKTREGKVKNDDLWKRLDEQVQRHHVRWEWVRGHSGVEENERCDELVRAAIEALRG